MATREEIDNEYVDYEVKFSNGRALKENSMILNQFNLEIYSVSCHQLPESWLCLNQSLLVFFLILSAENLIVNCYVKIPINTQAIT